MKLTRRFLALLLAFSMSLSLVTPAFASEVETVAETEAEAVVEEIAAVEEEVVVETSEAATEASETEGYEEEPTESPEDFVEPTEGVVELDNEVEEAAAGEDGIIEEEEPGLTPEAPIDPEWEWNDARSEATAVVTVPAGEIRYVAITFEGMELTVNGGESSITTGTDGVPQILEIINDGAEDADYELMVAAPLGDQMNPEVIWDLSSVVVNVEEGDSDGYCYSFYNPAVTGTLTFVPTCETEGVEFYVMLTNKSTGEMAWLVDSTDGTVSVNVNPGDTVTIQVGVEPDDNFDYPAAEITLVGEIIEPVGSMNNPEILWNITNAVVSMEEGDSDGYYYSFYNPAATGTLTFAPTCETEGVEFDVMLTNKSTGEMARLSESTDDTVSIEVKPDNNIIIQIATKPDDNRVYPAAEIALNGEFAFPVGSLDNPEDIYDIENAVATLTEGDFDGYYFRFRNRAAVGDLVFAPTCATEGVIFDVILTNMSTGEMAWLSESTDGTVSVAIQAWDEVGIQVVAKPDANWVYPAAEIALNGEFAFPVGSLDNPEVIHDIENAVASLAEGDDDGYYLLFKNRRAIGDLVFAPTCATEGVAFDVILTNQSTGEMAWLFESTDGTVSVAIQPGDEVGIQVAVKPDDNWDYPAAEIALNGFVVFPIGSSENPAVLDLYELNCATLEADNGNGYLYSWTADAEGDLTIKMSNGKAGWFFVLNNLSAGIYGDNHYSCGGYASSETIHVNAGDEIQLIVNTCGATENDMTPAGEVYFEASFEATAGIESNPYIPEWNWDEEYTEATVTVVVPAGCDVYYIGLTNRAPMMLSINGGEAEMVYGGYPPVPFALEGNADEDTVYELYLFYPDGTMDNPMAIEAGSYTAEVEDGTEGMFYSFTAPSNGDLTVAMKSDSWFYVVNNMTSWSYGDQHRSDDDPVVDSETLSVEAGDEIVIQVNTYDPEAPWAAPAGSVDFEVSFLAAEGTEGNPSVLMLSENMDTDYPINVGMTHYFTVQGVCGMQLDMSVPEGAVLEVNGNVYVADQSNHIAALMPEAMMGMPARLQSVTFSVTIPDNEDFGDVVYCYFSFGYPLGSELNPQTMILGKKNTANVEAGDKDGYLFYWYATGNGVLEVTMNTGKNWFYCVDNMSTGVRGDNHNSGQTPVVKKQYVYVSMGDEILIRVNTYNPADPWNTPAGKIEFTPKLIESYKNTMLAGKSMTLKYLDAYGKTVSASKVEWEMVQAAEGVTLKNGALAAAKTVVEPVTVVVNGTYQGVTKQFVVDVYPAATAVTIYIDGEEANSKTTLNLVTNDFWNYETEEYGWPELEAVVSSEFALDEVIWKSSNTKVIDIMMDEYGCLRPIPMGSKGSATITATAADGSGVKASFKINTTTLAHYVWVSPKDNVWSVGAGKTLTMIADVDPDATNKKVDWALYEPALDEYGWPEYDENGVVFALDENGNRIPVPSTVATVKAGKVTAAKNLTETVHVIVCATAQDAGKAEGCNTVTLTPLADKVEIFDVPSEFDLVTGEQYIPLNWDVCDVYGESIYATDVTWKSSNTKVADFGWIDDYDWEIGDIQIPALIFTGKTGKVTLTATAADGSGKKASVTVNVVKSPSYVELPESAIIAAGKSLDLSKAVTIWDEDASNKKLIWSIEDNTVGAKVSNGKVSSDAKKVAAYLAETGAEYVELEVAAAAELGGATGYCAVKIYPATTSVSIMNNGASVGKTMNVTSGDPLVLYAEAAPANAAGKYSWTSSNPNVAYVTENPDGSVSVNTDATLITKVTKVTITATAVDGTGKKASVTLNVDPRVVALGLEPVIVVAQKSVNMNSKLRFLDWNAEWEYYFAVTPASKTVTWELFVGEYNESTEEMEYILCADNTCDAGTLDAKTGVFKANKVTEVASCYAVATYVDANGNKIESDYGRINVSPVALNGLDIFGCARTWDEVNAVKITGKTATTTAGQYYLDVVPTNPEGDSVYYMTWVDIDDWDNFYIEDEEVPVDVYDEEGNLLYSYTKWCPKIIPFEDGDPYGTVKVTIRYDGGSGIKKVSTTINFKEPDPSLLSLDVLDITQKDIFDEATNTATVQSDIYGVLVKAESDAKLTVTAEKTTYNDEFEVTYTAGEAIAYNETLGGYIVPLSEAYEDYDSEYTQTVTITATVGVESMDYTVVINRECDKAIHDLFQQKTYAYNMGDAGVLELAYNVYFPSNFDENKQYPVVLALHGQGQMESAEGNASLDMIVKRNQLALAWAKDSEKGINECIVVAPQMSPYKVEGQDMWGGGATLHTFGLAAYDLLEKEFIAKDYVDEDRIYVTGLSLGGVGTYAMIASHPETFAGAIIACGATYEKWYGYDYSVLAPLSGSIYLTHAQGDPTVDYSFYEQAVAGLEAAGIAFETKVWTAEEIFYPHAHYSWTPTFADESIRNWLFEQVR